MPNTFGRIVFIVAICFGTIAGVVLVGLNALLSVSGLFVGLFFAAIYLLVGTYLFKISPMWPKAGWKWYLSCLLWGSGVSLLVVTIFGSSIGDLTEKLGWIEVSASFGGAYPEEIAKTLGTALILLQFNKLNRPWHGFVTGGIIGLGFETIENLLYGVIGATIDSDSDFSGTLEMWQLRSVAGPGLHITMSALAGLGVGYAMYLANISFARRLAYLAAGFLAAFTLHFCWNILWDRGNTFQITWLAGVALVLYPTFIYCWYLCNKQAKLEGEPLTTPQPITRMSQLPRGVITINLSGTTDSDNSPGEDTQVLAQT